LPLPPLPPPPPPPPPLLQYEQHDINISPIHFIPELSLSRKKGRTNFVLFDLCGLQSRNFYSELVTDARLDGQLKQAK
jgi:hypothetical protein